RQSVRPFQLGSATFPAGTRVIMLPWVIHRKAAFFASPDQFRPERWLDGSSPAVPRHAYMPFGAGPRMCIGRAFALMEMQIVVATVLQRYRLHPVPGHQVLPEPLVTLRPKSGVRVVLERRDLAFAQSRQREAGASRSPFGGTTCPFHGGSLHELP
ncbi:MAG: cytochrome P450, partial [Clostridia bacterium]